MRINRSEWKKVGEVLVDSGQIFITDPCYLQEWKPGRIPTSGTNVDFSNPPQNDYDGVTRAAWGGDERAGRKPPYGAYNGGVAISGFGGDGRFGVYVRQTAWFHGGPMLDVGQVLIDFAGEMEEDEG